MCTLHKQDIFHRDLKLANVLVTSGLVAKVADFGDSKVATNQEASSTNKAHGTIHYMPPAFGDERAHDVYAFGVCLWEMFSACTWSRENRSQFWDHQYVDADGKRFSVQTDLLIQFRKGFRYKIPVDTKWPSPHLEDASSS
jgi:serine/threonine protein kinase